MMNSGTRIKGGTMPEELQVKTDRLIEEFVGLVDALSQERHLQRGIARSLLPCSIVALLESSKLYLIAQFRSENRTSTYIYEPDKTYQPRSVVNSACVEFGFTDPFLVQFPKEILHQSQEERRAALEKIAAEHIDSEFMRLEGLLSLLRTRPIFGPGPSALDYRTVYVLSPSDGKNYDPIARAVESIGLVPNRSGDISAGKSEVREMWLSINEARIIVADLTGADPSVMYGLGIAHTVGKDTLLIHPEGSVYLVDIPRTQSIVYQADDEGRSRFERDLSEMIRSMTQPIF